MAWPLVIFEPSEGVGTTLRELFVCATRCALAHLIRDDHGDDRTMPTPGQRKGSHRYYKDKALLEAA